MSSTVLRRAASSSFQSRWALAAESKAASSWSRVHSGAWAKTSPFAGLITPNESEAGTESPPMVMTKSDMVGSPWGAIVACRETTPGYRRFPGAPEPRGQPGWRIVSDRDRLVLGCAREGRRHGVHAV